MKLASLLLLSLALLAVPVAAQAPSLLPAGKLTTIVTSEAADLGVLEVSWSDGYGYITTTIVTDYATAAAAKAKMDAAAGVPGSTPDADPVVAPDSVLEASWTSGGVDIAVTSYKLRTESIAHFVERHAAMVAATQEAFPVDDQEPPVGMVPYLISARFAA
jgi:hypothetical protein